MLTPEQVAQLTDLGATGLLIMVVAGILIGLFRQWWVPGWIWRQLRADWQTLRDQADRNAKAIEMLADEARRRDRVGRD